MFKKILSWWHSRKLRKNYYCCSQCGYIFPKKNAKISGWQDHPYGLHVHCPNCGHVVAKYVKP